MQIFWLAQKSTLCTFLSTSLELKFISDHPYGSFTYLPQTTPMGPLQVNLISVAVCFVMVRGWIRWVVYKVCLLLPSFSEFLLLLVFCQQGLVFNSFSFPFCPCLSCQPILFSFYRSVVPLSVLSFFFVFLWFFSFLSFSESWLSHKRKKKTALLALMPLCFNSVISQDSSSLVAIIPIFITDGLNIIICSCFVVHPYC